MCSAADLQLKLSAYHQRTVENRHHRYRSWEHCYGFFKSKNAKNLMAEKQAAALHLGFYLASWGMYRGSTFLLQHAYTIHVGVVERLASPQFSKLRDTEVGARGADEDPVARILDAVAAVKDAYAPFGKATDTLATKVLLGTSACLPACDRFFIDGFKAAGHPYSKLNERAVERMLQFCTDCGTELRTAQARLAARGGTRYPLMKLVDMYFWQIGYEAASRRTGREPDFPE